MSVLSPHDRAATTTPHSLVIAGQRFEVTVMADDDDAWRWRIAAPGGLALSGAAASEFEAMDAACRAGRVLAACDGV